MYLVTVSHPRQERSACGVQLRAPDTFDHAWLRDALLDSAQHPVYADTGNSAQYTGAPSVSLEKMVIFREFHAQTEEGAVHQHFHVALQASRTFLFLPL